MKSRTDVARLLLVVLACFATVAHAEEKAKDEKPAPTFSITNLLPIEISKNYANNFTFTEASIASVDAEQLVRFPDAQNKLSKRLRADSIYQPQHMAIIRVDFTFDAVRESMSTPRNAEESHKPALLIDSHGQSWKPIAYVRAMPSKDQHIRVRLPGIKTIRDFNLSQMSKADTFHIYYMVQRPCRIVKYDLGRGPVDLPTPLQVEKN